MQCLSLAQWDVTAAPGQWGVGCGEDGLSEASTLRAGLLLKSKMSPTFACTFLGT